MSLSLSKEVTCLVQAEPLAGESGCTWMRGGELGSALPATIHDELRERGSSVGVRTRPSERGRARDCVAYLWKAYL